MNCGSLDNENILTEFPAQQKPDYSFWFFNKKQVFCSQCSLQFFPSAQNLEKLLGVIICYSPWLVEAFALYFCPQS